MATEQQAPEQGDKNDKKVTLTISTLSGTARTRRTSAATVRASL